MGESFYVDIKALQGAAEGVRDLLIKAATIKLDSIDPAVEKDVFADL